MSFGIHVQSVQISVSYLTVFNYKSLLWSSPTFGLFEVASSAYFCVGCVDGGKKVNFKIKQFT